MSTASTFGAKIDDRSIRINGALGDLVESLYPWGDLDLFDECRIWGRAHGPDEVPHSVVEELATKVTREWEAFEGSLPRGSDSRLRGRRSRRVPSLRQEEVRLRRRRAEYETRARAYGRGSGASGTRPPTESAGRTSDSTARRSTSRPPRRWMVGS